MAALASDWLRHFRLLLLNHWTEFNETWQEARSQRPLLSLCFSSRSEKQDGRPGLWLTETFSTSSLKPLNRFQRNLTGTKIATSSTKFVFFGPIGKNKMAILACDWLRHFRLLLLNHWTEFNETWQEARSQRPLPSLCFSGRLEKQDGCHSLWLAETLSNFPLKPLNGIQRNLTGSKISTSSTKFVFFGPVGKNKMAVLASDWLRHFRLLLWNHWTEFNETWQEARSQRPLPSLCFSADRKNKMAAVACDWLRHFRLLLWNHWTEFNKTWQEARSQRPLPSLCFSGLSEKQDGRPGLWLAELFLTSPLKPLNGIQRNLTGSKISTSSTKFVFSGRSVNKNVRLGCPQKGGILYSGARYVALWASCLDFVATGGIVFHKHMYFWPWSLTYFSKSLSWAMTWIRTFVVSRAFMAGVTSQAGDTDSSQAPGLTSGLQGSMNVHRGALLLVPQWQCISSFVSYIFVTLVPFAVWSW